MRIEKGLRSVLANISKSRNKAIENRMRRYEHDFDAWLRDWVKYRSHNPEKMHLIPFVKKCIDIARPWYYEAGEITTFEVFDGRKPDYYFMGGYGKFEHIKFNKGLYSLRYEPSDDWKNAPENEDIYNQYLGRANDRYIQTSDRWVKDRPYVLFPMQFVYPKDYFETWAAVEWATKHKVYTIFKRHPASSSQSQTPRDYDKFWEVATRAGITSEYTHFPVENYSAQSMIDQCDMMFSADSAMTLEAMLRGKPTFTMRRCQISDIVPILDYRKIDETILDIAPVPVRDQKKWLNWYWHSCVNDLDADNFEWKINQRRTLYRAGHSDLELHTWEFTKRHGLHS